MTTMLEGLFWFVVSAWVWVVMGIVVVGVCVAFVRLRALLDSLLRTGKDSGPKSGACR